MTVPDLSGMRIGRYQVEKRIGAGSAAVVYHAVDLSSDEPVALKVLDPDLAGREGFLERCAREIEAVARLDHPAIVPVLEVATRGSLSYLSMRLVGGGTLRD